MENHSQSVSDGTNDQNLRIEDLASIAKLSIDTIRFYQTRGLIEPPFRNGRQVYYDNTHLERLEEIRELQKTGLSLNTIRRIFNKDVEQADIALFKALAQPFNANPNLEYLTIDELSLRTSIPSPLLMALVSEGLIPPIKIGGVEMFPSSDINMAKAGLALLESGIPLSELLELAKLHHKATKESATQAIKLFDTFVRNPITGETSDLDTSEKLIEAFNQLLPAAIALVSGHFERTLVTLAQKHLERVGAKTEIEAVEQVITTSHQNQRQSIQRKKA